MTDFVPRKLLRIEPEIEDLLLITAALKLNGRTPTAKRFNVPEIGPARVRCERMYAAGWLDRVGQIWRTREDHILFALMLDEKKAKEAGFPVRNLSDLETFARSFLSQPVGIQHYQVTREGAKLIGVDIPGGLFPSELKAMRERQAALTS
jgi:hypothetical protein